MSNLAVVPGAGGGSFFLGQEATVLFLARAREVSCVASRNPVMVRLDRVLTGQAPALVEIDQDAPAYGDGNARGLYRVIRGMVQLRCGGTGVGLRGPGDYFGESCLGLHRAESAWAVRRPVEVAFWPSEQLIQGIDENRTIEVSVAGLQSYRGYELTRLLVERTVCGIDARLTLWLRDFAWRFGFKPGTEWSDCPMLRHEVIALEIGATRETVTNALRRLVKLGAIQYSRMSLLIAEDRL